MKFFKGQKVYDENSVAEVEEFKVLKKEGLSSREKRISRKRMGSFSLTYFFSIWLLVAVVLFYPMSKSLRKGMFMRWEKTEASITDKWITMDGYVMKARATHKQTVHIPVINYTYTVEDKEYQSSNFHYFEDYSKSTQKQAQEVLDDYDKTVDIFYLKDDPAESAIKISLGVEAYSMFAFWLLIFGIGVWGVWPGFRSIFRKENNE